MSEFKISAPERKALQLLVNGERHPNLPSYLRARLLYRGWIDTDYKLNETGRTVARQLGIRPMLKFFDDEQFENGGRG